MKLSLIFLFLLGISVLPAASASAQSKENSAAKSKTPVLVELFTSEGCSSCPPADKVLTKLATEQPNANADIITLEFHVDYWNYLGWKDEFSLASYSERQGGYAGFFGLDSNYTPQMVVDGQKEFVGSSYGNAAKAITDAVKNEKAAVEISAADEAKNTRIKVKINDVAKHDESYIWLAVTEDNLTSNVRRGENSGRYLSHTSVVRTMKLIGNLLPIDKNFENETVVNFPSNWNRKNLKFVVFVQGKQSKKIFALNRI